MKDYAQEIQNRVTFIQEVLSAAHADGLIYGNSGGKDCTLVGILCKMACDNTVGLMLPCSSQRNYGEDKTDAERIAHDYGIETRFVDLSPVKDSLVQALGCETKLTGAALTNIAPRLRMTALYAVAAAENRLVVGTGNRSEIHMGYFTKWGDGAYDLNPIADLTVTEIYELLRHLGVPAGIINKPPSGGLFDGQTDEQDMGITYRCIDEYLLTGQASEEDKARIQRYHAVSEHKRGKPAVYASPEADARETC